MRIRLQKFGGTALANEEKRQQAAEKVITTRKDGYYPVVVVSAMGRRGQAYATDTLLDLIKNDKISLTARNKDLLLSCGEIVSAVVMAAELTEKGQQAIALTGAQAGIITDDNFGSAVVKRVDARKIMALLKEGKIPVIAGFQGITVGGEITTLGRGGSDTTAAVLAYALKAEKIEIYTDVPGIFTTDPDKYAEASKITELTHQEICELSHLGAKIIEPKAAEIAREVELPIEVKYNGKDGEDGEEGTLIDNVVQIDHDRTITGVATRDKVVYVEIDFPESKNNQQELEIFKLLAERMISLDMINIRTDKITFLVDKPRRATAEKVLKDNHYNFKIYDDFCKVSVVGSGMTGQPGVMARVVACLKNHDIRIYQTVDSHTTISCLLKQERQRKAIAVLHEEFNLK